MKLACAAWGFKNMTVEEYLDTLSRLGIRAAEIHGLGTIPLKLQFDFNIRLTIPTDMGDEELSGILALAREKNIEFIALATANDFTTLDKTEVEKNLKCGFQFIDLADRMGIKILRILAYAGWLEERPPTESFTQVADCLNKLAQYAEPKGIYLAVENHAGVTGIIKDIKELHKNIRYKNVGLTYDPANFYAAGEDPIKVIGELSEHFIYCHLKDCRTMERQPDFCEVGEGILDYPALLNRLEQVYNGYCAIEYENTEDVVGGTRRSLDYLEKLNKFPELQVRQ